MNPLYKALSGDSTHVQAQTNIYPSAMPGAGIGGIFAKAQQLANTLQNPQQLVSRFFPDAPAETMGNPDQLLAWMQQTGKVTPQMVQMARQMVGR